MYHFLSVPIFQIVEIWHQELFSFFGYTFLNAAVFNAEISIASLVLFLAPINERVNRSTRVERVYIFK